jgi:hypothetical protein
VLDSGLLLVADSRGDAVNVIDAGEPHAIRAVHGVSGPTCVLVVADRASL